MTYHDPVPSVGDKLGEIFQQIASRSGRTAVSVEVDGYVKEFYALMPGQAMTISIAGKPEIRLQADEGGAMTLVTWDDEGEPDRTIHFGVEDEPDITYSSCPVCGAPSDYCQGHGEIGDPAGFAILQAHDDGNHSECHPDSDLCD